jgi:hypothetical protein
MTSSVSLKAIILVVSTTIAAVSAFTSTDLGQGKIGAAAIRHALSSRKPSLIYLTTGEQAPVRYGEASRKYRRTVYSHDDWLKHRASDSLFINLASTLTSGIVRQLLEERSCCHYCHSCGNLEWSTSPRIQSTQVLPSFSALYSQQSGFRAAIGF